MVELSNCCVVRYSHRELLRWKRRFSSLKYGDLDSKVLRFLSEVQEDLFQPLEAA